LMPAATISELSNVSGLDPVVEMLARERYGSQVTEPLWTKARIYYARTPAAYEHGGYPEHWLFGRKLNKLFTGGQDGNYKAPAVDGMLNFIRDDLAINTAVDRSTKP
jgi:hypothetical protein